MKEYRMEDYELTPEMIKACKKIKKAVEDAQKIGVYLLGKNATITAYNAKAYKEKLVAPLNETYMFGKWVPDYRVVDIADCGGDDMEHFRNDINWVEDEF